MVNLHTMTIVSGGQTGADRAALDFAINYGIPHGGWCPRDRLAEDGPIHARYQLQETPARRYAQRTEWNVRDSDGTVVFSIRRNPIGGTRLTLTIAQQFGKRFLHISRDEMTELSGSASAAVAESARQMVDFLDEHAIARLNIAGPRASQEPEIGAFVNQVLLAATHMQSRPSGRVKSAI
jgi:hypothetical protein